MSDEIAATWLKILQLKQSIAMARSDTAREYAQAMLKEQEAYLAVLEAATKRLELEPVTTSPPKEEE